MFTFHIHTMGCKVNQYESQALREHWEALGGREVEEPDSADLLFLATCAVTAEAVAEARRRAGQWGRLPGRLIVAGCSVTAAPGDFPGGLSQEHKPALLQYHPLELPENPVWSGSSFIWNISGFKRARPVVKVQDGCSHGCTYCIVPLTRGRARSRAPEEVLAEIRRLLASEHREIMLSGVNLRQYRHEGWNFWRLLRYLQNELAPEWQGRLRLRLSSLEPAQLDAEGLESLEASTLVCPHLHISLQSGSDAVLRRMGRGHYRAEDMLGAAAGLQRFWPVFGLGADILMGFPGESEAEYEETLNLVRALPFSYAHVFPWSSRPGTRAAAMPDILPKAVRQAHAAGVRELIAVKKAAFLEKLCALPQLTLAPVPGADSGHEGVCGGVSEYYTACLLEGGSPSGRDLLRVSPLRIEGEKIICHTAATPPNVLS